MRTDSGNPLLDFIKIIVPILSLILGGGIASSLINTDDPETGTFHTLVPGSIIVTTNGSQYFVIEIVRDNSNHNHKLVLLGSEQASFTQSMFEVSLVTMEIIAPGNSRRYVEMHNNFVQMTSQNGANGDHKPGILNR